MIVIQTFESDGHCITQRPLDSNDLNQDCTACSEGEYCETVGLVEPTGPCNIGYYCKRGVGTAAPTTGITTVDGVRICVSAF